MQTNLSNLNQASPGAYIDSKTLFNWELCKIAEKVQYLRNYKRTQSVLILKDPFILEAQVNRLKAEIYTLIDALLIANLYTLDSEELHRANKLKRTTETI